MGNDSMLEVRALTVSVGSRKILKDINLHVERGETVVLFGPNGSGKTSLLKTIIGYPNFVIEAGEIIFNGRNILGLSTDERARLGIGIAFQRPPAVRGVRLSDILKECMDKRGAFKEEALQELARKLELKDFLDREMNLGFSGGEIKRSELLQLLAQGPDLIMLDEPDSGVDLVSVHMVGRVINELLEKDRKADRREKAGMIITHAGYILDYVNADRAYVLIGGDMHCSGNPRDVLADIRKKGYEGCVVCER